MKSVFAPLKERLEIVWNDPRICCPSHITKWTQAPQGYTRYAEIGLFYNKGRSCIKRRKPIGHELNKNYGPMSRMSRRNRNPP